MFPCHPIIPILLLCFSSSITKGRWSLKTPRSFLLEGAIMLVTSECFFSWTRPWLRSGLTQVVEELSPNWGQLPFVFIPTGHFPPNTHIYAQFLGPQFPCGFPLEHEMQDGVYISSSEAAGGWTEHFVGAVGYIPPSRGQQCLTVNPKSIPLFRDKPKQVGSISGASSAAPWKWGMFALWSLWADFHWRTQKILTTMKPFRKQRFDPFTL